MHTILNFIAVVKPDKVRELEALLKQIHEVERTGHHHLLPLATLERLHFASLTVFHDPPGNYDPYLVFEHNFDGEFEEYLADLYERCAEGLHQIYKHCFQYEAEDHREREDILAYLRARVVRPDAYHIGNVGRSVERIRREAELRDKIELFLDSAVGAPVGAVAPPPNVLRYDIQEFVRAEQQWAQIEHVPPRISLSEKFKVWARLIGFVLLALAFLPVLLLPLIVFVIVLRHREKTDRSEIRAPDPKRVVRFLSRENHIVQNHMASLCYVKPGAFRRTTIRVALRLTNLVARVSYKGRLTGLTSLHFAHWVLIDNGRRLLFLTNYDGSWERYLDDFIQKAAIGLTGIWSNTDDFPRTRFLVFGGATDALRFKAISRHTQAFTNVWYSAYPDLTVQNIDNNSAIREGLFKPLGKEATRKWLWRF